MLRYIMRLHYNSIFRHCCYRGSLSQCNFPNWQFVCLVAFLHLIQIHRNHCGWNPFSRNAIAGEQLKISNSPSLVWDHFMPLIKAWVWHSMVG
ncbi:hypothetical protein L6452_22867 [Arctium lappa]|uniref:Uncharacterized protein n=1 Tax=Arctium lappa TaxID=4217 RepID=A0ACB9B0J9_ARCLA|nr:hypothetical protein L6452_22867 [Arctium lappa]